MRISFFDIWLESDYHGINILTLFWNYNYEETSLLEMKYDHDNGFIFDILFIRGIKNWIKRRK